MKAIKLLAISFLLMPLQLLASNIDSSAKQQFLIAKQHIENMLCGKEGLSYEKAIYEMENAWWDGGIDYASFKASLDYQTEQIKTLAIINQQSNEHKFISDYTSTKTQKEVWYRNLVNNHAIYQYLTNASIWVNGDEMMLHQPFTYSHNDPMGTSDWTNTQVTHLINEKQGNCFALASLFKIFAERLHTDAQLCTAPSHIFITHADEKGVRYNIELASNAFPCSGTLATLTHTTNDALKNGIALRELNVKQSIALCLVELAKGYENKLGIKDDEFMMSCATTALQYDEHNLNAMLLKAQILEERLVKRHKKIEELQNTNEMKEYEQWITYVYQLGYKEMPFEMKNLLVQGWTKDTVVILETKDHIPMRLKKSKLKDTRYASLSWGLFDEEIVDKPFERFSSTIYDTKKKKIIAFVEADKLYNDYNFDPVVFAWNVDPLAHQFPHQSPYCSFDNSPIWKVDPDGRAGEAVASGNTLTIYSNMVFYGGAANSKLADVAANNIQSQWNAAHGSVLFNGKVYNDVKFVVTAKVVSENVAKNMAAMNAGANFDPRLNFARIESRKELGDPNKANRVYGKMTSGDNSMFLLAEDIYYGNTNQAHEYGHSLGMLFHVNSWLRWSGIPRIMTTIHTAVDSKYTKDGNEGIPRGENVLPLHQLNQDCRQVTQEDINGIKFSNYKSDYGNGTMVGDKSNILFDKKGNPKN